MEELKKKAEALAADNARLMQERDTAQARAEGYRNALQPRAGNEPSKPPPWSMAPFTDPDEAPKRELFEKAFRTAIDLAIQVAEIRLDRTLSDAAKARLTSILMEEFTPMYGNEVSTLEASDIEWSEAPQQAADKLQNSIQKRAEDLIRREHD